MTPTQAKAAREKFIMEAKSHIGASYEYGAVGPEVFKMIQDEGSKVFFDGKFHDIPNTVARAGANLIKKGITNSNTFI